MKKGLITTLVVLLLVCVAISSVQAYTNKKYNFSVDPPSGWTVDDTTTGAAVFFYGPTESGFRININIQVESLTTDMTVEQYASAAKDQLQNLANYQLVSERTRVINGVDAYELVITFTYAGIDIKAKQVLLVKAKMAYIITCGASPTTYQKYLSDFESCIGSFKIIEPTPWYIEYWYVWVITAVAVAAPSAFYLMRRKTKAMPPPTPPPTAPPSQPPTALPTQNFCSECGAKVQPDAIYCDNCGKKLR